MFKVQMYACAIRKLLYDFASVQAIIHSLHLVDYLPVQTHKPYTNFCGFSAVGLKGYMSIFFIPEFSCICDNSHLRTCQSSRKPVYMASDQIAQLQRHAENTHAHCYAHAHYYAIHAENIAGIEHTPLRTTTHSTTAGTT